MNKFTVLILIFFTLASCGQKIESISQNSMQEVSIQANRIVLHNFDELIKDADFAGIVQSEQPFENQKHNVTFTEDGFVENFSTNTNVKILEVFKGDKEIWENFDLIEPASIIEINGEKYRFIIDDYKVLRPNISYIVFLKKNDNGELAVSNLNESIFPAEVTQEATVTARWVEVNSERASIYQEIMEKWWTK